VLKGCERWQDGIGECDAALSRARTQGYALFKLYLPGALAFAEPITSQGCQA
jgi:hypothetical protein